MAQMSKARSAGPHYTRKWVLRSSVTVVSRHRQRTIRPLACTRRAKQVPFMTSPSRRHRSHRTAEGRDLASPRTARRVGPSALRSPRLPGPMGGRSGTNGDGDMVVVRASMELTSGFVSDEPAYRGGTHDQRRASRRLHFGSK